MEIDAIVWGVTRTRRLGGADFFPRKIRFSAKIVINLLFSWKKWIKFYEIENFIVYIGFGWRVMRSSGATLGPDDWGGADLFS